jgi:hypothetical protein
MPRQQKGTAEAERFITLIRVEALGVAGIKMEEAGWSKTRIVKVMKEIFETLAEMDKEKRRG